MSQKQIKNSSVMCDTYGSFTGVVNLVAHKYVTKCTQGGNTYSDLTVIPSLNSSNPCEVCYCWVRIALTCDTMVWLM